MAPKFIEFPCTHFLRSPSPPWVRDPRFLPTKASLTSLCVGCLFRLSTPHLSYQCKYPTPRWRWRRRWSRRFQRLGLCGGESEFLKHFFPVALRLLLAVPAAFLPGWPLANFKRLESNKYYTLFGYRWPTSYTVFRSQWVLACTALRQPEGTTKPGYFPSPDLGTVPLTTAHTS